MVRTLRQTMITSGKIFSICLPMYSDKILLKQIQSDEKKFCSFDCCSCFTAAFCHVNFWFDFFVRAKKSKYMSVDFFSFYCQKQRYAWYQYDTRKTCEKIWPHLKTKKIFFKNWTKTQQKTLVQYPINKLHFINIHPLSNVYTFWDIAYFVQWNPKFSNPKNVYFLPSKT